MVIRTTPTRVQSLGRGSFFHRSSTDPQVKKFSTTLDNDISTTIRSDSSSSDDLTPGMVQLNRTTLSKSSMSPPEPVTKLSNTDVARPQKADADLLGRERSLLDAETELQSVKTILQELSEDEKQQMPDPQMVIRHFRAEKGNVDKAIEKLRAALQWRKSFGVDDLLAAMPPNSFETQNEDLAEMLREENETGKVYVRGYDREGRALVYMRPAMENTNNEQNNMRHLVWNLEKAIACTKRKSMELSPGLPPLEKVILMIDYEGFKLKNAPPMSTSKLTLDILQKHYPERMYRAYCLNPPLVFRVFWNMIKPFVDPVTKEKIQFCTGKDGMVALHDAIGDVDQLEVNLGGPASTRRFDSKEYLNLPFHKSFDE